MAFTPSYFHIDDNERIHVDELILSWRIRLSFEAWNFMLLE